jgi:hypothetical protein
MGFSFRLQTTSNYDKLKRKYDKNIGLQKKKLKNQLEQLKSQLKNNLIDQLTYQRHKDILEFHSSLAKDIKKQEQALKKLEQLIN